MEWLQGVSLAKRLKGTEFTAIDAKTLCEDIVAGLSYMHAQGVAHGDLHAANVILTDSGAKIIDVDVSKAHSLRALSMQSLELKLSNDIDYVRALLYQVLLHASFDLNDRVQAKEDLENAKTMAELRECVAKWSTATKHGLSAGSAVRKTNLRSSPIQGALTTLADTPEIGDTVSDLIEAKRNITLRKVLISQGRLVANAITSDEFSPHENATNEAYQSRVARYNQLIASAVPAFAATGYWASPKQSTFIKEALEIVANIFNDLGPRGGTNWWLDLDIYPAATLLYSVGIAATASRNFHVLSTPLRRVEYVRFARKRDRLSTAVWHWKAEYTDHWNKVFKLRQYTPISGQLEEGMRPLLKEWVPLQLGFEREFDTFEFLAALIEFKQSQWGPIGSFVWRGQRNEEHIWKVIDEEVAEYKDSWGAVKYGLFDSVEEYGELRDKFLEFVSRIRQQRGIF